MKYVFRYNDARILSGQCTLMMLLVVKQNNTTQIDTVFFGGLTTYHNGTNGIGQRNFYELTQTYSNF